MGDGCGQPAWAAGDGDDGGDGGWGLGAGVRSRGIARRWWSVGDGRGRRVWVLRTFSNRSIFVPASTEWSYANPTVLAHKALPAAQALTAKRRRCPASRWRRSTTRRKRTATRLQRRPGTRLRRRPGTRRQRPATRLQRPATRRRTGRPGTRRRRPASRHRSGGGGVAVDDDDDDDDDRHATRRHPTCASPHMRR